MEREFEIRKIEFKSKYIVIAFIGIAILIYLSRLCFADWKIIFTLSLFLFIFLFINHILIGRFINKIRKSSTETISEHFIFIIFAHIEFYILNLYLFQFKNIDHLSICLVSVFLTYLLSVLAYYLNSKTHNLVLDIFSYIIALGLSYYLILDEISIWILLVFYIVVLTVVDKV